MFGWYSGCGTHIIIKITRYDYDSVLVNGNKCLNWTCLIVPYINWLLLYSVDEKELNNILRYIRIVILVVLRLVLIFKFSLKHVLWHSHKICHTKSKPTGLVHQISKYNMLYICTYFQNYYINNTYSIHHTKLRFCNNVI